MAWKPATVIRCAECYPLQALGGEDGNQQSWELPGEGKFELSPEDSGKL